MAKRAKKKSSDSALGAKSFRLCEPGDRECGNADTFPHGAILPSVNVNLRPGFRYTTGTAVPNRTAKERRAHGCEEEPKGKFTGRLKNGKPSSFCKAFSAPCGDPATPRAGCPVQLTFIDGKPNLRFCIKPGEPGFLVPVATPEEADSLARKACASWPNKPKAQVQWPNDFFKKHAPHLVEQAQRAHPKSPWGTPGLGEMPKRGNPMWLAAGVALGVVAAAILKRQQAAAA